MPFVVGLNNQTGEISVSALRIESPTMNFCGTCESNRTRIEESIVRGWNANYSLPPESIYLLLTEVDKAYAGVFQILGRALDGREPLPPRLLRKRPEALIRIRFIIVDGPLTQENPEALQIACCVTNPRNEIGEAKTCPKCQHENRLLFFNYRFFVLCGHILSRLGGNESSMSLADLFRLLNKKNFDYKSAAPLTVMRDVAYAAVGFLLGHEFGHVLTSEWPEFEFADETINSIFHHYLTEELNADRNALRTLVSSQMASNPLDKSGPASTLLGAELVFRALYLIEHIGIGRKEGFDNLPLVKRRCFPTPRLRLDSILATGKLMGNLGLLDCDEWQTRRNKLFSKWEELR